MTTNELAARRFEMMVKELMTDLTVNRSIKHGTDYVGDVEMWPKAARTAGRRLKIPVRTGVSRNGTVVWASEGP